MSSRGNKTGSWRYVRPVCEEKTAPCSAACPVGTDIPRVEMLVARNQSAQALETILDENPFPAVCGHVCFHPCEARCNRSFLDQPVAIHHLERFVGNLAVQEKISASVRRRPANGRRVVIVGAGPAGLSAAYFLGRLGYGCDVVEAESSPGGLLRWGIPAYRLAAGVVEKEAARIRDLGVRFFFNETLPPGFMQTAAEAYDAAFVGCGQAHPISAKIAGEAAARDGLDFLKDLPQGRRDEIRGIAAVIGGGNTAVDVARTLVRRGATPVILYRRRQQDMPAFADEVRMGLEEGVQLRQLVVPVKLERHGPDILLSLRRTVVQGIDPASGRARVTVADQDSETLRVQHVFSAVGAEPGVGWSLPAGDGGDSLSLEHCTVVFRDLPIAYGGDLVNRTRSVADAVASGKAAAMALDTYFARGRQHVEKRLQACRIGPGPALSMSAYMTTFEGPSKKSHVVTFDQINTDYFTPSVRTEPQPLAPGVRTQSFAGIWGDLSNEDARREAGRCFNCGTCTACDNCVLFCPESAVQGGDGRTIDLAFCKGCGVCVVECPRNAMTLKEERDEAGA